jgi:hypothetical protein
MKKKLSIVVIILFTVCFYSVAGHVAQAQARDESCLVWADKWAHICITYYDRSGHRSVELDCNQKYLFNFISGSTIHVEIRGTHPQSKQHIIRDVDIQIDQQTPRAFTFDPEGRMIPIPIKTGSMGEATRNTRIVCNNTYELL